MKILNKLNKLVEESTSLELREKSNMINNYFLNEGSTLNTVQNTKTLLSILKECKDVDGKIGEFIKLEERLLNWHDLNLSENILAIYNTEIYKSEPKLGYILENISSQIQNGTSECLLIEGLRGAICSYSWSKECKGILESLDNKILENYNNILLYKTYLTLYTSNNEIYEGLMNKLESAVINEWDLTTLKNETKTWSYLSQMINLYNGYKNINKNSIQSNHTTIVESVYGLIDLNESSKEFIYVMKTGKHSVNNFITIENDKMEILETIDFDLLSDSFKTMTQLLESKEMDLSRLDENVLKYYLSNDVLEYKLDENTKEVSIKYNNVLLESEKPFHDLSIRVGTLGETKLVHIAKVIYENFQNIVQFDDSHKLISKLNENITLSYLTLNENIYTTIFDKFTGQRIIEKQDSITKMVDYIKESFHYDLTETFYKYLNEEKSLNESNQVSKKIILKSLEELGEVKIKLHNLILSESFDNGLLEQALELVNNKIIKEKEEYNEIH